MNARPTERGLALPREVNVPLNLNVETKMKIKMLLAGLAAAVVMTACETTPTDPDSVDRNNQATGEMCGGIAGFTCGEPQDFCMIPVAGQCGAADQSGTCTTKPEVCTLDFNPVCGCDGNTYPNACAAAAAGVSVSAAGECPA